MLLKLMTLLFMAMLHYSSVSAQFSFSQPATGPSSVCVGNNVTLQCRIVFNDNPRDSVWYRNGTSVRVGVNDFIPNHNQTLNSTTGVFTDLVITNVTLEDDNTVYTCTSSNGITSSIVLNVSGLPSIFNITNDPCLNDIMLSWNVTSDLMACGLVSYTLTISSDGMMMMMVNTTDTYYQFTELTPETEYTISIQPSNRAGSGQSYTGTIRTAPETSLAKVEDKCLDYIVIQIIQINETFCGGDLTYIIILPSGNETINGETSKSINGLTKNTNYSITVIALRRDDIIHQNTMVESTLESLKPPPVAAESFSISPPIVINENDTIYLQWTYYIPYDCIPKVINYTITIIINGSTSLSEKIPGNLTMIDMSYYFPAHPMPYNIYDASIVVINSEGESSPTGAVAVEDDFSERDGDSDNGDNTITIVIVVVAVAIFIIGTGGTTVGIVICMKRQKVSAGGKSENAENQYTQANGDTSQQKTDNKDDSEYAYAVNGPRKIVFPSTTSEMPQKQ